ncbi:GNAT family N-acetyltransferase [Bosea sp. OK403]|uniref:GNAT family N-acetyltransferase n=1 Tax=Bosea sp. OK403 TaxID=1855286 RepID=UPI000B8635AB|nr:GNAT family N-acetyltransferase [Bosea sp. OK403]
MDLPDLPPDLTFARLPWTSEACDFAFEAKRAAMGPHILHRWSWDEAFQRNLHQCHFNQKPFFMIGRAGQSIGTISFKVLPDHVRLGEFYLLPAFHGQGFGTAILRHCLSLSDELGLPVRLEHLHWNPVRSLYQRHGFVEIERSETHCFLERPASRRLV